jgi:hypothetical protein
MGACFSLNEQNDRKKTQQQQQQQFKLTVMVHFENTATTNRAVVSALRFDAVTSRAVPKMFGG